MIKITDMMQNPDIVEMKQESLYALSKEKHIQQFLKENHLNPSIMDENWVEFLDYNDDYHLCAGCQSSRHGVVSAHGVSVRQRGQGV